MKKSLFKKTGYIKLLAKYNALLIKYNTLEKNAKSELYDLVYKKLYTDLENLEYYKEENKRLRKKINELKELLPK